MLLRFIKKNLVGITFLSLLTVSFLLMSMDVKKRGKLSMLDEVLMDSASLAQRGTTSFYQLGKDVWFGYIYLTGLREENMRLRDEAAALKEQVNGMRETTLENQRLRELLAFKESTGYHTITARVIGTDPSSLFKTITIGKGSAGGIRKNMAVVTNDGVVGRVLSLSSTSAKVLLITDRNSNADAIIQRSRDRGIAEGREPDLLQLKYLPRSADVVEGDLIVTSGIGGVFQKGLVMGTVSRIDKKEGGIFQYVEISPVVNFSKLEEVLVITDSPQEDGV